MTLSSSATWMSIALGLSLFGLGGQAHAQPAPRFKAVAFDYFVIFDANSVVPEVEKAFPGKGAELTRIWRSKQFEYCYLRTITGRFADFSAVTEDALVYAAEVMHLDLTTDTRQRPAQCLFEPEAMARCGRRLAQAPSRGRAYHHDFSFQRANASRQCRARRHSRLVRRTAKHRSEPELQARSARLRARNGAPASEKGRDRFRRLRRLGRLRRQELRLSNLLGKPLQCAGKNWV